MRNRSFLTEAVRGEVRAQIPVSAFCHRNFARV